MPAPEDDELDPRAALELLGDTDRRVRARLDVDNRILLSVWGVAWFFGYGAIWFDTRGQDPYAGPGAWSLAVMGVLMMAALVVTIVTITRATRGVGGAAATSGMMYGLTWPLAFTSYYLLLGALARAGASDEIIGLAAGSVPALIVGIIYLGGAALWRDWPFFTLGAWLVIVTGVAALTGPFTYPLVLAVVGGAGFLGVACWSSLRRSR